MLLLFSLIAEQRSSQAEINVLEMNNNVQTDHNHVEVPQSFFSSQYSNIFIRSRIPEDIAKDVFRAHRIPSGISENIRVPSRTQIRKCVPQLSTNTHATAHSSEPATADNSHPTSAVPCKSNPVPSLAQSYVGSARRNEFHDHSDES